jgi:hypothetical protein
MPTVQTAAVLASTVAAQKIPVDMDANIRFEETGSYRFEYISRKLRAPDIRENMKTEWIEQSLYPCVLNVTGASAGTTIPVDNPQYAHRDQLIFNVTKKSMCIMNEDIGGTGTAGSITVVAHTGSGNIAVAAEAGDVLLILPEAHAEGEAIPPAFSAKPDFFYTYLTQSDETLKVSDIAKNQNEYGIDQYLADRKQQWIYRKRGINLSLLVGREMRETASASVRRHSSQGLENAITSNKIDASFVPGSLGLAMVGNLLQSTTRPSASSDTKIGCAGANAMVTLSALPMSQILTSVASTEWGKKLNRVITPFGSLSFDHDRSLTDEFGMADIFIILDPKSPIRLQYRGLPERMVMNVNGTTDFHNQTDLFTGTWGLKLVQEFLNAWIFGIA